MYAPLLSIAGLKPLSGLLDWHLWIYLGGPHHQRQPTDHSLKY
jgi:hypothetical protein